MPEKIELVPPRPQCHIAHQPETRLQGKDPAAMHNRGFQSAVAVVVADKKIESLSTNPSLRFHVGQLGPCEGPFRF